MPLHKQIAGLNKEIGRVSTKIEKYKRVIELEKTYLNKLNKACRELGDIKLLLKRHGEYVINGSKTLAYDCQTIASAIEGFYSASEFSPESNESISIEPGILNKEYKQLVKMSNDISSFLKGNRKMNYLVKRPPQPNPVRRSRLHLSACLSHKLLLCQVLPMFYHLETVERLKELDTHNIRLSFV